MNSDTDHTFGVPPALEDEMGTELRGKVQTRGERPGSSETADKMTPATPAALAENIRTVPNTVAAAPVSAVPAVSGARDTFIEPADAGGEPRSKKFG